nr:acetolactate synthase large subunit [Sphingomonas sp. CDS-1]
MNGAQALVHTLANCGVDVCFANPGTSEMHFVAALDIVGTIRPVLALFEGVATGAADGYARMAGKPAATLLHLGAGLGNGLANLHNARRAGVPMLNIVGDHATGHLQYDAPLTSDIVGIARPVSPWVYRSLTSAQLAHDGARAVAAAHAEGGQVATLIVPADTAWGDADGPALPINPPQPQAIAPDAQDRVVEALAGGHRTALLMRGRALHREGLEAAARIAAATGARLLCDTFAPRLDRGAGIPAVERIPYFAEMMTRFLADIDTLILVGARVPVPFFAYPDKPGWCLAPGCRVLHLAYPEQDSAAAVLALADRLPGGKSPLAPAPRPERPTGAFNVHSIGQAMGALLKDAAIICDDAATASGAILAGTANAAPHTHLALTGGAIGSGLPMAVGAAIACPDRKVVCISGDGSAMYTPQALWTIAREKLDVTVIIFANRSYRILQIELERVGAAPAGPMAHTMLDLSDPTIDFVGLALSMGVESARATTIDAFCDLFAGAMRRPGPYLIEVAI